MRSCKPEAMRHEEFAFWIEEISFDEFPKETGGREGGSGAQHGFPLSFPLKRSGLSGRAFAEVVIK